MDGLNESHQMEVPTCTHAPTFDVQFMRECEVNHGTSPMLNSFTTSCSKGTHHDIEFDPLEPEILLNLLRQVNLI